MSKQYLETLLGSFIILGAVVFLCFAYRTAGVRVRNMAGYQITANFDRADGLQLGSDVRIAGIKIGQVTTAILDPKTYKAIIEMHIDDTVKIPADSSAQIVSDGLLGGKYMVIVPGGEEDVMHAGGVLHFTQSSVNLESLIGQMIFSKDAPPAAAAPASPEKDAHTGASAVRGAITEAVTGHAQ